MKTVDRLVVILFALCLIIASVLIPITVISSRDVYFVNQFKKCGIYPEDGQTVTVSYVGGISSQRADFSAEQMDEIIAHITAFLSNKKKSFAFKLDDVNLNGKVSDSVDIFGEEAVTHMEDVKIAFTAVRIALIVCIVILLSGGIYMLRRKTDVRKVIYKYSLGVVIGFFGISALFLGGVFIKHIINGGSSYFDTLWESMHHIFFPFDSDKFNGSFFNDTLTQLLTLEFFMNTVITIVVNLVALTAAWLFSAKLISKR